MIRKTTKKSAFLITGVFLCLLIYLSACAQWFGFPAYYDSTTYKQLTDLKPRVLMLYDKFSGEIKDQSKIEQIRLKFAQIYEYEKGKGLKNVETYSQIDLIRNMFEGQVRDRMQNGIWSEAHLHNQKVNISEAFDIAIQTEKLKNKNI
jgi:hypothetical protein